MSVDGEMRTLIASIPQTYSSARPHRLVLAFHGRTNPAERVRAYFGLEKADRDDSIMVYPQALRQKDGTFIWRIPEDLRFFDALVARFAADYCIETDAVFAVGHSLGASFVNTLACARGTVLRGVMSVAGGAMPADCAGRAAALLLHNPEDRHVPVDQGEAARDTLLAQNGLKGQPAARYRKPFDCVRFGPRSVEDPVVWCLYDQSRTHQGRYYPHLWPEGAEEAALDFFSALD